MSTRRSVSHPTPSSPRWSAARLTTIVGALLVSLTAMAELPVAQGSAKATDTNTTRPPSSQPDWAYTLRPDDTVQTVANRMLAPQYSVRDLMRVNGLTSGNALHPGDTLTIPLNWLEQRPEPAVTVAVNGTAHHISGRTGQQRALKAQQRLRSGDEVRTQAGFVVIQLADGSMVRLGPDSQLVFNHLSRYRRTAMVDTRLRLQQGSLQTDVEPLENEGSRFEVHTPSAVAAVRGTAFRLQAGGGRTQLQVTEGTVAFGPPGETEMIPSGYSATSGLQTRDPVDIRRLPARPDGQPLPETAKSLPLDLNWDGAPGDSGFQVDIFNQETQAWVGRRTVKESGTALEHLDNGHYRIQVAALNRNGVAGMPWEETVTVAQQARAANLVEPANGAELKESMPSFRWDYQGSNEVGRIEVARTTDFADPVATSEWAPDSRAIPNRPLGPGQYHWRVVTETGGTSVATSEPRAFTIKGTLPPTSVINVNYVDSQVRIFWEAIDGADDYRLQLAEDPGFSNIVRETEIDNTTAALRLIPGRRYFVRLKALSNTTDKNGRWGPPRELFVN